MTSVAIALRWRPEWPVIALVMAAWLYVLAIQWSGGHELHTAPPLIAWTIMSLLMMVPVTLPAVRHLAFNSFKRRRPRAITIFISTYLVAWAVFGVVAIALVSALESIGVRRGILMAAAILLMATWQLTPLRAQIMTRCRRAPSLPPTGARADRASAAFALEQARHCMIVCWPAMLLMAIVGHQLWLMILLTIVLVAEEYGLARKMFRR